MTAKTTNLYRSKEWLDFRAQIIQHDGGICRVCSKGEADGITLQVHHKKYRKGVLPWDYDPNECETLCMRHHAEHHEKIRPSDGWDFLFEDDLGGLTGECEACGTSIRYVFHIAHPKWDPLAVGTYCCDRLTGTTTASELRLKSDRKERFLQSENWVTESEETKITRMKMDFGIRQDPRGFYIRFSGKNGNTRFKSLEEAKEGLFSFIDSGDARRFKQKMNKK